jgi:hypothetical protein
MFMMDDEEKEEGAEAGVEEVEEGAEEVSPEAPAEEAPM